MLNEITKRDKIEKSLIELFDRTLEKRSSLPEVKRDESNKMLTNQSVTADGIITINESTYADLPLNLVITFGFNYYEEFTKLTTNIKGSLLQTIDSRREFWQ